ncbi:MAG: hypothetical protein Q7S27_02100 [Nanoarchaeota archaeon]|nr:hypothetical protein [Nanoarchaeota archaeon]
MKLQKKRGLSPVIASVLLIAIALIVATMIFFWAKNFVKEKTVKFDEPIENSCPNVEFNVQAVLISEGDKLIIQANNLGNVPIYGVEVRRSIGGAKENVGSGYFDNGGMPPGTAKTLTLDVEGKGIEVNDELLIVPILLGETEKYKRPHTCAEEFGEEIEVQS